MGKSFLQPCIDRTGLCNMYINASLPTTCSGAWAYVLAHAWVLVWDVSRSTPGSKRCSSCTDRHPHRALLSARAPDCSGAFKRRALLLRNRAFSTMSLHLLTKAHAVSSARVVRASNPSPSPNPPVSKPKPAVGLLMTPRAHAPYFVDACLPVCPPAPRCFSQRACVSLAPLLLLPLLGLWRVSNHMLFDLSHQPTHKP
jgi:hypothetical protein